MPEIVIDNVCKHFGASTALDNVSLTVRDGELLVLLGPSGCGKSTLLRILAGLSDASSGAVVCDGRNFNSLEPRERGFAFVFQSYALYPHMTVLRNIAFPLLMNEFRWYQHLPIVGGIVRAMRLRSPGVRSRVGAVASLLELETLLNRHPKTLSGGQRQRVAVGRAIVNDPQMLLMDEPLSNLDAKLRGQMRTEIMNLHRRLGSTIVYVTHDQVEAMTMGTRIAVLNNGILQQIGTPREIYDSPANAFVARFVGTPPMSVLPARCLDGDVLLGTVRVPLRRGAGSSTDPRAFRDGPVLLGIRSEDVRMNVESASHRIPAVVSLVEDLGAEILVRAVLGSREAGASILSHANDVLCRMPSRGLHPSVGDRVELTLDVDRVMLFDADTQQRIGGSDPAPAKPALR